MVSLARQIDGSHPEMAPTFISHPTKAPTQEAQESLRDQLRKNPHPLGRSTWPVSTRAGVRTGFFCRRRLKRLAPRSCGSSVRRDVFGRCRESRYTTMAATQTAVEHQTDSHTTTETIAWMECPADGTLLDESWRDGMRIECPRCTNRWRIDQAVVVDDV